MNVQIDKTLLNQLVSEAKKEKAALGKIINPLLENHQLEDKEILEVCQIAKFIATLKIPTCVLDKGYPPNPDFLINYQGRTVGLEHTRILTPDSSRIEKLKTLLDFAGNIFRENYPNEKVHGLVTFKGDKFDYSQSEKKKLAIEICDLVHGSMSNHDMILPNYLSQLRTTNHSKISFSLHEEKGGNAPFLTKEILQMEVQKKEKKIKKYNSSVQILNEICLVLMVGSASSISYELNDKTDYSLPSRFDRVYLMKDFENEMVRVK